MKRFFLLLFGLLTAAPGRDLLVVCGGPEIFTIDPISSPPAKLWSWRAKDRPELPAALGKTFNTTTDCKLLAGGDRLLISSSGRGNALLEFPSGKLLWSARVTNSHSIEPVSVHPGTGRMALVQAKGGKAWWSDQIALLPPPATLTLPGETIYKARWLAEP